MTGDTPLQQELFKCNKCGEWKTAENFQKDSKNKNGLCARCKKCEQERMLEKRYGITLEEYNHLLDLQEGKCKVCGKYTVETLHVDHDHSTGEIRGLLCSKCNTGIGLLQDDPDVLLAASNYVRTANELFELT